MLPTTFVFLLGMTGMLSIESYAQSTALELQERALLPAACKKGSSVVNANIESSNELVISHAAVNLPITPASLDGKTINARGTFIPQHGVPSIVLQATYFYTCELTGTHSRRFTWAASHAANHDLMLTGVTNIDSFSDVLPNVPSPSDFQAAWMHVWDVTYADRCCKYFALGHIFGTVYVTHIDMDLYTFNAPAGKKPYVSEDCHSKRVPPPRVGRPCTITYVSVERI